MGSTQSTHTTSEITDLPPSMERPSSVSGRKASNEDSVLAEPRMMSIDDEDDASVMSSDDDYDAESDEEEDEEWNERLMILEDNRKLLQFAEFYLQPEKPVAVDATACARCFCSRYSAPEQTSAEEEEEAALALADTKQLKQLAMDYLHPELPVKTDPVSFGRNYFTRPSAEPQEDLEEAEERARILEDMKQMKKLAVDYLHPEKPVVTSDPCATGRNYFTRPSAEGGEEDMEERTRILADMKQLKQIAVDYLHPENPVVTSDPCATGRNYFARPSAEEYEDEDDMDDRDDIMADMKQLKQLAVDYLQPERPVEVDPLASCRNYFTRPSAEEYEDEDDMDARDDIMADMKQLKQLAVDYLHPEKPVVTSDGFASSRNYFTRPSAADQESLEEAEERARILADVQQLKKLAVDYLHPENPVVTSDPCATGRNYFTRPSAQEYEDDMEERARVLEDTKQLKKLAIDYLHPERPVVTSDPCATGRNYFTRPSAQEYEDEDFMDELDDIMEDMKRLKQLAQDYLQPERPVEVDPLAFSRNYFTRPSAEPQEDLEEAQERVRILADAQQLKKLAVDYLHPEKPVVTSSPYAMGRNYFTRPSAEECEDEDMEERSRILEDMKQMKKLAVDYLHPEKPVETSDPCATGRNYFTRPSAQEYEDEEEMKQREEILADMKHFKQLAVDYLHPEKPVVTSDGFATGRNYFTRPSAEEYEDEDDMDERDDIMEDMKQLKQLAQDYLQPERAVAVDPLASSRNYFTRPSAADQESWEEAEERARILEDMKQMKKLAVDYLHPEKPVVTSDPCATGRNYFTRPSAQEYEDDVEERTRILEDMKELKQLAVDYLHPEKPVVTSDPFATGRNYFTRPSAEEYEDEVEERARVLEDMKQLKKLAVDYLHPEKPVVTSDPFASGRNYFMRDSAPEQVSVEATMEHDRLLGDIEQLKKLATDYLHPEKPVKVSGAATGRNYFDRPSAPGHSEQIHSQGQSIEHGYTDAHVVDNDYYHYHHDYHHDYHHEHDFDSHSHQSDHFEMDEDMFQEFRESLSATEPFKGEHPKEAEEGEEEGKLSRSPSSVMLFEAV